MAVEYLGTSNKRIDFSTVSTLQNIQQKTFIFWVNLTGVTGEVFGLTPSGASDEEWGISFPAAGGGANRLFFYADWSTTQGQWYSTNTVSTGIRQVAVSYDFGSSGNSPVLYVDGASVAVTTGQAASGTYRTGTSNSVRVGSFTAGAPSVNGSIMTGPVYNRILSASEIADAYASKLAIPSYRGLIFAPQLWGCAGGVAEGGTMAAGNTVADAVSGALGVPSGSPVFKGDTVLTFQS